MDEDDFASLRPRSLPADLQSWNIEDLSLYIDNLRAEIARVEAKITEKKSISDAAASLFKS